MHRPHCPLSHFIQPRGPCFRSWAVLGSFLPQSSTRPLPGGYSPHLHLRTACSLWSFTCSSQTLPLQIALPWPPAKLKVRVLVAHVQLFVTAWTAASRLLCPRDSPGKNTGVGSHSFLQENFLTRGSNTGLLHCRRILYRQSHQGSPRWGAALLVLYPDLTCTDTKQT